MKVKLFNQTDGSEIEVYPVDAREIVAVEGGPWGFDKPVGITTSKGKPVKQPGVDDIKKSPLRLVPNLTQAGEAFLRGFGIETLEELSATPFFRLETLDSWKALEIEDQEPIESYMQAAATSAQTKSSVSLPGRPAGKATVVGPKVAAPAPKATV